MRASAPPQVAKIRFLDSEKEFSILVTNEITRWRVETFWQKETDTLRWIENFKPDDLFVDIGANIGVYSLYAACCMRVRVLAFEPESLNYALLNTNIYLNKMGERIRAFPLALSDETALDRLHLSQFVEGGAIHNYKESNENTVFSQGCFSMTLDEIVEKYQIGIPQHIKIDVDGIEHKILQGAQNTLSRPELRSVLVELNSNLAAHAEAIDLMLAKGFIHTQGPECEQGPCKGMGNHLFYREFPLLDS